MGHPVSTMRVDDPGHVVNATRFSALTGVSRERLRMWERRHGFPVPRRESGGPRRYALVDVPRVVAVRRAAEQGVPIPAAIARTRYADAPGVTPETFGAMVDHAPLPALLVSGPAPLRVEYVNAAAGSLPGAPRAGDDLSDHHDLVGGDTALDALRGLFTGSAAEAELELPGWTDAEPALAFRLPIRPDERPLVALAATAPRRTSAERADTQAQARELAALRDRDERHTRWLDAAEAITLAFQIEPGPTVLDEAADILIRRLPALDAVVASSIAGGLALPRSRRGLLEPAVVTVAGHPELARRLRSADPHVLETAASVALGVPDGAHGVCAPILVGGEALGALVLLFGEPVELGAPQRRLLTVASAALGFALLRDRLATELRAQARAST